MGSIDKIAYHFKQIIRHRIKDIPKNERFDDRDFVCSNHLDKGSTIGCILDGNGSYMHNICLAIHFLSPQFHPYDSITDINDLFMYELAAYGHLFDVKIDMNELDRFDKNMIKAYRKSIDESYCVFEDMYNDYELIFHNLRSFGRQNMNIIYDMMFNLAFRTCLNKYKKKQGTEV